MVKILENTRTNKKFIKSFFLLSIFIFSLFMIAGASAVGDNQSSIDNVSENKTVKIDIKVNYEYADDEKINPGISVKYNNHSINYTKSYNTATKKYTLIFNHSEAAKDAIYTISLSAPGYNSKSQNLTLNENLTGNSTFTMDATASYKIGREVTKRANALRPFANSDKILVITTAGMVYVNGKTSEDGLEGIINGANGYVGFGLGNLLTLSSTRTDPLNTAFIIKDKNGKLYMIFFSNGSSKEIYNGLIGTSLNSTGWKNLQNLLGNEDAYSYVSIANAWDAGLPADILTTAAYHGHVCTGLISGQAMIQALLKYYPPIGESGLPLENTAYYVLGVPGGSDDDAFTWNLDITPGKRAYIGIDTMVNKTCTGFIRWNSQTKTGLLIIMSYNEERTMEIFKNLTGLNPKANVSNDLIYQKWLIETLMNNPTSLVDMIYEFEGLNETHLFYLMGEEPGKGTTTQTAHGLDMEYILNLYDQGVLSNATREIQNDTVSTPLTDYELEKIGEDAALKAKEYFLSLGIDIEKDNSWFYVLTSAGYVRINETSTNKVYDGIYNIFGSQLSRKTLLPVHTSLWKDLVFDFFWVDPNNNSNTLSYSLRYDPETGELLVTGNSSDSSSSANYIIQEVLKYDPPYDALIAWLFHNHVCGGSSPGYLIADYIYEEHPLGENESYIYITTSDNCKDDIISRLLGVSPGMGNYFNLRFDDNKTNKSNVGIIIKWNSVTKTGTVSIVNWVAPKFAAGSNSYEEYIKLYKGDYSSANLVQAPKVSLLYTKLITESDLQKITSGGSDTLEGDSLAFIMGLPYRTLDEIIPPVNNNGGSTNNGGTKANSSSNNHNTNIDSSSNNNVKDSSTSSGNSLGSTSSSAGLNTVTASAATESASAAENDGSKGSSYEVSKATTETNSLNLVYAIIIVLIVGGLAGFGYMRHASKK